MHSPLEPAGHCALGVSSTECHCLKVGESSRGPLLDPKPFPQTANYLASLWGCIWRQSANCSYFFAETKVHLGIPLPPQELYERFLLSSESTRNEPRASIKGWFLSSSTSWIGVWCNSLGMRSILKSF